jgi:hypothetical protein
MEMSQDADKMKRLVEFREKLGRRIQRVEAELKDLQATLETVNSILMEKGFRRAETIKEESESRAELEQETTVEPEDQFHEPASPENVVPLKTASGELMAVLYLTDNSLRALPAADKNFDVNTPPFMQFLVERVLTKMQERDSELIRTGQLPPDRALTYSIIRDEDILREICVNNVDEERLRELKSSIRWTLEKMFEKTKPIN